MAECVRCGTTLTHLAPLGTLSRNAMREGGPSAQGLVGEGSTYGIGVLP